MIFMQRTEEQVAKISDYKILNAIVIHTKADDGTTKVEPSISIMGLVFNNDEAARLLEALPRAIERAGALAAKVNLEISIKVLRSVPYESLEVTGRVLSVPHDHEKDTVKTTGVLEEIGNLKLGNPTGLSKPAAPTNCAACAYSGIEPNDMDLACGHPDAGTFGVTLHKEPAAHCPNRIKFEQHPGRNPDGSLKNQPFLEKE